MAADDQIAALTSGQEQALAEQLEAAFAVYIDALDAELLATMLDDIDANHIREQLALALELDEAGEPAPLSEALGPIALAIASFIGAVVALAAAQARHTINPADRRVKAAQDAAAAFQRQFLSDTTQALRAAIERAIYDPGNPVARARQLKRTIGLTMRQADALDVMQSALRRYLDSPRKLMPSRVDSTGKRIPAHYVRQANVPAIIAATRGHISAAQRQILVKALATDLSQAQADAILDRHAAAMRRFRLRAAAGEAIHGLAEQAKFTGWRIAQAAGALPATQRRHWRTAGDERVRHAHRMVPSMNPGGVSLGEPFATPFGEVMFPPLEWGCRCRVSLRP